MSLDYEKILYSNPSKKLRIQHEELKKNFSEASAKEYSELNHFPSFWKTPDIFFRNLPMDISTTWIR